MSFHYLLEVKYVPFLLHKYTKIAAMVVLLGLLAMAGYGGSLIEQDFRIEWFIPGDSYLQNDYAIHREHFSSQGVPVTVYAVNVDPYKNQDLFRSLSTVVTTSDHINPKVPVRSWFTAFEAYLTAKPLTSAQIAALTEAQYDTHLKDFFAASSNARYVGDVTFEGTTTNIKISKLYNAFHKQMSSATQETAALNSFYNGINDAVVKAGKPTTSVFAFSFAYTSWVQYEIVLNEAISNIAWTLFAIFMIVLFLMCHVGMAALITLEIAMVLGCILGVMPLWGVSLDGVVVVNLVLAIGLSVDYSIHIAHSYLHAAGTREQKVTTALTEMGVSVVNGATSTFLAVLMLSLSKSYIFVVFFKLFFLTCLFGLSFAMMFLPVILSVVGPTPEIHNHDQDSVPDKPKHAAGVEA
jgi:predicted RND superfamily exporter protein